MRVLARMRPSAAAVGDDALAELLGKRPDFMQQLLLGSALQGTELHIGDAPGGR